MWWHSVLHEEHFFKNLPLSNNGQLKISPFNVSHGICSTIILYIFYVFCRRRIPVAKNHSQLTRKEAVNKKKKDSLSQNDNLPQSVLTQVLALSIYNTCLYLSNAGS